MADVLCAGVIVADVLVSDAGPDIFSRDMTRLPLRWAPGGDACNQAGDLAALGVSAALCGKVGADGTGDAILSTLERQGVSGARVVRTAQNPTSVSIVLIRPDGERHLIGTQDGTNSALRREDFDLSGLSDAKIFSLGSLYGSTALTGRLCASLLAEAKAAGCKTVLDLMQPKRGSLADAAQALAFCDLFLANEAEACALTGASGAHEAARILADCGAGAVAVKQGARGCLLFENGRFTAIPACRAQAIDTTGAGDALAAGTIAALLEGKTLAQSLRFGCACGALAVEQTGAFGAVGSRAQVEERLRQCGAGA